jgi:hypothetical protein
MSTDEEPPVEEESSKESSANFAQFGEQMLEFFENMQI